MTLGGGAAAGAGDGRVMVGVRCSLRMEVPLTEGGELLVSERYVRYLVEKCNEKFAANLERIAKLERLLRHEVEAVEAGGGAAAAEGGRRGGRGARGRPAEGNRQVDVGVEASREVAEAAAGTPGRRKARRQHGAAANGGSGALPPGSGDTARAVLTGTADAAALAAPAVCTTGTGSASSVDAGGNRAQLLAERQQRLLRRVLELEARCAASGAATPAAVRREPAVVQQQRQQQHSEGDGRLCWQSLPCRMGQVGSGSAHVLQGA